MKIALLTDGIWPFSVGGMQKHSYYLCKYLSGARIKVDVYYTNPGSIKPESFYDHFSERELSYINFIFVPQPAAHSFPGHYLWEMYQYSKTVSAMLRIEEHSYSLIYVQGLAGWAYLTNGNAGSKPITLLNMHGLNMFQTVTDLRSRMEQIFFRPIVLKMLKKADYVQSLGGRLTEILTRAKIKNDKIIELGIGIESSWLMDTPKKCNPVRRFVFVGRFDRVKGVEILNQVLQELIPLKDFKFDFIGPIPAPFQIHANKIRYHGQLVDEQHIKQILHDADFLVLPSLSEGMPTVVLEAMACSCAVIATDVGAVAELVSDKNGILIEPNDKAALTDALISAMEISPEQLQNMQQTSRTIVENKYDWSKLIETMIANFNQLVAAGR